MASPTKKSRGIISGNDAITVMAFPMAQRWRFGKMAKLVRGKRYQSDVVFDGEVIAV